MKFNGTGYAWDRVSNVTDCDWDSTCSANNTSYILTQSLLQCTCIHNNHVTYSTYDSEADGSFSRAHHIHCTTSPHVLTHHTLSDPQYRPCVRRLSTSHLLPVNGWRWVATCLAGDRATHVVIRCRWLKPHIIRCHYSDHTHTYTHRFLSGKKVKNCTLQLEEPRNFPQPYNTTLLHEFYLATT